MKKVSAFSKFIKSEEKAGYIYNDNEVLKIDAKKQATSLAIPCEDLPPSLIGQLYGLPPIKRDLWRSLPEPVRDLLEKQYGYMKYDVQSDSICISES